jgi:ubiquinone/menaquinone biosynthesis C-methylase UbiE
VAFEEGLSRHGANAQSHADAKRSALLNGGSMDNERNRVCPVELANSLDNKIRRWLQNPQKILAPYMKEGMTVLDIGCGPGFFSLEMAKMVGKSGKVISADLQEGMLQKLRNKIKGTVLEERIKLVKCDKAKINISEKVDFILAFYMAHEVPDKNSFFKGLKNVLNEKGQFLLVEPKFFHVSQKEFKATTVLAENNGFIIYPGPKLPFSWSAILKNA